MIFRDDDISFLTKLDEFKKVHEFFNEYNCIHTIALLTKGLEKNPELIEYIRSQKNIDVQVHSHEHVNYIEISEKEAITQLITAKNAIKYYFFKEPTTFYPPFNFFGSIDERIIEIAQKVGLETSWEKTSPLYYIKYNGRVPQKVLNFHYWDYWDYCDSILIGPCLKLYKQLQ